MAHAAGSFLISPFKKAAILTADGVGEWTTTSFGFGEDNKISLKKEIVFPHSLGLLYSAITSYLGFSVNNSEYKVMGLSPYGNMNKKTNPYYEKFNKIINVKKDGSYKLDMSYFVYHYKNKMPSKKLCKLLGGPTRKPESEITDRHKDIAAALQIMTEETMTKMLNHLYKETNCENLILAGGVGLNSVYNGKILKKTPFKNFWSQPDPGDGGTSIGAAVFAYYSIFNNKRRYVMNGAYLGVEYNDSEIKRYLEENDINFSEFKNVKGSIKMFRNL